MLTLKLNFSKFKKLRSLLKEWKFRKRKKKMSKEIGLRKNSKISKKQLCVSQQEQEIDGKLSLIILAPELRSKLLPKRKKFKPKNKRMLTISARQMLIWKRERLDIKKRPRLKLRKKLLNLY